MKVNDRPRLSEKLAAEIHHRALRENRKFSNMVECLILEGLRARRATSDAGGER
jgi:hypothetical protein